MIVSALLQPCYNLLHATLLHSGWWPLELVFLASNLNVIEPQLPGRTYLFCRELLFVTFMTCSLFTF